MFTKTDGVNFLKKHLSIFFRDITALGSAYFYGLVMLLVLAFEEYRLFWILFFGVAFVMLVSVIIRLIYFKNRPNKENHHNILEKIDASSFPSIHVGRVWFMCFVMVASFELPVGVFFVLLALTVSYSRIHLRKHDYFDLLGGFVLAVITYFISSFLF